MIAPHSLRAPLPRARMAPPRRRRARALRPALSAILVALLAACGTTPPVGGPGNVSRLPPGNAQRDGPEAHPPANLDAVPDAVPQIEARRNGGPNKPYEIAGQTYVPLTDDRAVSEKGLASWYGKKFHGRRTASGEAYNMYAMTAAHKTLPIPSYARVRNPANGHEVIVRVNDRGPFAAGRIIDLSYTAALKLGVLGGVQQVEITRITDDDIRSGAAFRRAPVLAAAPAAAAPAAGDLDRVANASRGTSARARPSAQDPVVQPVPPDASDVIASAATRATPAADVDLGAAAAADSVPATPGTVVAESSSASGVLVAPATPTPARAERRDEQGRADTTAGVGFWLQLGAFKQREGALQFQRRLIDEQAWLAPLLAVFTDHGLNKLQAGPYTSRDDAKSAAEHVRSALQLVPTIVEKR
jgi:rare lipoprotein A